MTFKDSLKRFSVLLYTSLLLSLTSPLALAENQSTEASAETAPTVQQGAQQEVSAMPSVEQGDKININTATAAELQQLNGIGEKKAQAIVSYRDEHGKFTSVEQLTEISGIGPATITKNQHMLTF